MQVKFTDSQKIIMSILIGDATDAAKGKNRDVYRHGNRLLNKVSHTSEISTLKRSDLSVILGLVDHTLNMSGDFDTSDESEESANNREDNLEVLNSLNLMINGILNES